MKLRYVLFFVFIASFQIGDILAQNNVRGYVGVGMSKDKWRKIRDDYAVSIIMSLAKLDTLNSQIDSLKKFNHDADSIVSGCEENLYSMVGATRSDVNTFRVKFEDAERKLISKSGNPSDNKRDFYSDIASSRITCLPEFHDRYMAMKDIIENWTEENTPEKKETKGTYVVAKGDCLWGISQMQYGSPYFWPAIWNANKESVMNGDDIFERSHKKVVNPELIYPGQILKIPVLSADQKNGLLEKRKKIRKL